MSKKNNKKKKGIVDVLLTLILMASLAVFCYAGYNLFQIYREYKAGRDEYNAIAEMAVTERTPDKTEESKPDSQPAAAGSDQAGSEAPQETKTVTPPMEINFASLRSVNSDVNGWLYVEALDGVSYPVVHGSDNDFYLHRTYEKNYNFAGTIFVDYANSSDFTDCNTIVYGHNMKNGSMFGQLNKFTNRSETFAKSKYFWIFTPQASYRYEIIAAYVTSVNSDTYTLFKGPGEDFERYLQRIVSYSQLPTKPTDLSIQDRIVTLSTCTGDDATRYVVQGRRVDSIPVGQ